MKVKRETQIQLADLHIESQQKILREERQQKKLRNTDRYLDPKNYSETTGYPKYSNLSELGAIKKDNQFCPSLPFTGVGYSINI